jgi:transcriptional regulator with XRE-family HTH domain
MPAKKRMPIHPLKLWLWENQVTQDKLASRVGLKGHSMFSLMFTGRRKPSRDLAERIAKATRREVSVADLLSFEIPRGSNSHR